MKIINYEVVGERIKIEIDNGDYSHFNYSKHKFNSFADLKQEIQRSIASRNARKSLREISVQRLTEELEEEKLNA